MAEVVYFACALTSIACAVMLFQGYRRSRARFLLWSALCFSFLTLNNGLLFIDRVVYPEEILTFVGIEFSIWRGVSALLGMVLLLFGLIWDVE